MAVWWVDRRSYQALSCRWQAAVWWVVDRRSYQALSCRWQAAVWWVVDRRSYQALSCRWQAAVWWVVDQVDPIGRDLVVAVWRANTALLTKFHHSGSLAGC